MIQANSMAGIAMITPPCSEKKPLGITSEARSTMCASAATAATHALQAGRRLSLSTCAAYEPSASAVGTPDIASSPNREVVEQSWIRRVGRAIEEHEGGREAGEQERDEADEPNEEAHRKDAHAAGRLPQPQPDADSEGQPEPHRGVDEDHRDEQRRAMRVDVARDLARARAGPWERLHFIDDCAGDPKRDAHQARKASELDRAVRSAPGPLACRDRHAPHPRCGLIGRSSFQGKVVLSIT